VIGCFAALQASELGLSVALVEERAVFGGASSRAAGVYTVQLDTPIEVRLVVESIELVKKYSMGAWRETGFLQIGREEALSDTIESLKANGVGYQVLDSEEVMERWPIFNVEPELAAVFTEPDLSVEPPVLGAELRAALAAKGVKILEGIGVRRLNRGAGAVASVELSTGSRLEAENYILALGSWTREVLRSSGFSVETRLLTCFAHRIDVGGDLKIPSFSDEYLHTYWRPWGTQLIGGRYDAEFSQHPDLSNEAPPPRSAQMALNLLRRRLRIRRGARIVGYTRGPCSFTGDGAPLHGPLPGLENAYVVEGVGGYGLMMGPALGRLAVEALLYGRDVVLSGLAESWDPSRYIREQ